MTDVLYDGDADLDLLTTRRIAIVGYGNQAHAHAHNLRDSGCPVRIGLREPSPSRSRARSDEFDVGTIDDVVRWGDVVCLLTPDQTHAETFEAYIRSNLRPGKLFMVAHGFSVHFGFVRPPSDIDVALVAPVGPGALLRRLFLEGSGIPAVFGVHQDASGETEALTLAYARALGCTRAGAIRTTFQEETETDLFGEQAVLCGGLNALIEAGFDTLVQEGYQPEIAFFECVHQIKLLADLIYEGGLAYTRERISETAEFGDYIAGPRIIDGTVRENMRAVLRDVQDGTFAQRWMDDWKAGAPVLLSLRERQRGLLLDVLGDRLRARMAWTETNRPRTGSESQDETRAR